MSQSTGKVFAMKNTALQERLKVLENYVCDTMTAFEESWMDAFLADRQIMKPMIWCLRELAGMSPDGVHGQPIIEKLDAVEAEFKTMLIWIKQNYTEITFDLEMRGIEMSKD